ncbi:MAG: phosphoribosylamine--glycine ligase [Nitrospirae bacterium]|nr:MAG: phosphoribosylamine--glycine ligase [Nitrospirota bacterium]
MKVLVIGGGGREHAIVWKLAQSRHVDKIYCTPGNAGIAEIAECIEVGPDVEALIDFVKYNWIDITIVGPEEPLSRGIVDAFEKEGRKILGPTKAAAQLEWSKAFSKDFMRRHRIPTADYKVFTSYIHAQEYVRMMGAPRVIKADGLAAGKGVVVASTVDEAMQAIDLIMKDRAFGAAGDRVIVEDCLVGEEASFMVFTDGKTIAPMASAQDHKRIFDNDRGPNTGGMGAYSPAPVITPEMQEIIMATVMRPTIDGLQADGIKYKGILYAGLMIADNKPYVLEYNCRLGDPETQPVLFRLETDLVDIALAVADERLGDIDIAWKPEHAICVVIASKGYPGAYEKGAVISGIRDANKHEKVVVFHAGTAFGEDDACVTSGGRVLGVTASGADIVAARDAAYRAIQDISFDGMQFRKDIAMKAIRTA